MDPRQFRAFLLMLDALRLSLEAGLYAIAKRRGTSRDQELAADNQSQRALRQAEGMVARMSTRVHTHQFPPRTRMGHEEIRCLGCGRERCPACLGDGTRLDDDRRTCRYCHGDGTAEESDILWRPW